MVAPIQPPDTGVPATAPNSNTSPGYPIINSAPNAPAPTFFTSSTSTSRQPRAWLVVNGASIVIESCEVMLVRLAQASTFEATMALDDPSNPGPGFWSQASQPTAMIVASNDYAGGGAASVLIQGKLTHVEVDFVHRTVIAHGADAVVDMASTRNEQPYPNQPTSSVVSQIAGKHGLGFYTDGGGDMAGTTYDKQDYRLNTDQESDLDVVQGCAVQDGKVAFVNGGTLYYVAPGSVVGATYPVEYSPPTPEGYETGNVLELKCSNDFTLAPSNINPLTSSWFAHDKKPNTAGSAGDGAGEMYDYTPGRTQPQVQDINQRMQRLAEEKEYKVEVRMVGDVVVQPTMMLGLSGTESGWDLTYFIESVKHEFSIHDGYTMEIEAKNSGSGDAGYSPQAGDNESQPPAPNNAGGDNTQVPSSGGQTPAEQTGFGQV